MSIVPLDDELCTFDDLDLEVVKGQVVDDDDEVGSYDYG